MDKKFTSTNSQLRKLRSRGLIISNGSRAKRILKMENYYNLINGYKEPFIDKSYIGPDEKYIDNTNFNEIYALYLFDRELRNVLIRYILEIENNVKSILAHDFSKKYGNDNYLKIANFDTSVKKWESHKSSSQKIGDVADLIANFQRGIALQLKKNSPMISHNMLTYGYVPLWVLINTITLGTTSIFYSYLKEKDQNDIGKPFCLKPSEMVNFLFFLSIYRNACAHDERLYNFKSIKKNTSPNSIKNTMIHQSLRISKNNSNNYICGKNDLFAIVIIFKCMLSKKSFSRFFSSINKLIERLSKELNTIDISKIQKAMGFPSNWQDIKNI